VQLSIARENATLAAELQLCTRYAKSVVAPARKLFAIRASLPAKQSTYWTIRLFRSLLGVDAGLLTHSSKDNDVSILAFLVEHLVDLVTNFTVGDLDIFLGGAIVGHEREETVVGNIKELVLATSDVGNVHVVGGGAEFFQLLGGEDVDGDQMDLGVTVLSGLGGGHLDDLARAVLDADETVLPQGRALHGVGKRRTRIGAVEGVLMLRVVVGHGDE